MASSRPDPVGRLHAAWSRPRHSRRRFAEIVARRGSVGLRIEFRGFFTPIQDDDESFPWRPIAVLLGFIVLVVATVITLSFLVAWLVTGQAY